MKESHVFGNCMIADQYSFCFFFYNTDKHRVMPMKIYLDTSKSLKAVLPSVCLKESTFYRFYFLNKNIRNPHLNAYVKFTILIQI